MSALSINSRRTLCFEPLESRQLLSSNPIGGNGEGQSGEGTFTPPPATISSTNPAEHIRVLVLNFEPTVPSQENQKLWEIFGWNDPRDLSAGFISDMETASGGAVDYEIVEWRDLNEFPIFTDGFRYTADEYVQNRITNSGWANTTADFHAIAEQQGVAELVNNNEIDEIWMFGDHYFNLLGEAWMAGPESFFINGPTFSEFAVDRAVAGFGFNYERGVAEMIHNHGHRTENHISRGFGGWNIAHPTTPWDLFTANVAQSSTTTYGIGSIHYPFNGQSDYDYTNLGVHDSYADDFVLNYPNQTYATMPLSRDAWGDLGTGDWHRGYMQWFFGHIPRGDGNSPDDRPNNWYKWINDFNAYRPGTGLPRDNEAILGAPPLTKGGTATYEFTVRYYDQQGIDVNTLDHSDVLVTGPGGYQQLASLVEVGAEVATTAGTARTVTYQVTAPSGVWDPEESGTYSVDLEANQVHDTAGAALPAATLGNFQVNVSVAGRFDITAMLATGEASVDATPWDIGSPDAIFDTSTTSLYRSANINPANITLSFTDPITMTGVRTLFSHGGGNPAYQWSLEAANTLEDLNGQSGSYQLLLPPTGVESDVFSSVPFDVPITARYLRLTVEKLTDGYVHINSWEILGEAIPDTAAPSAVLGSPIAAVTGGTSTSFDVRFNDDIAVDIRSVNFGDVRVTGPNGFSQTAALYQLNTNANGPMRDVTYFASPPGGAWDSTENGVYTLELVGQQVYDTAGKSIPATVLGEFTVEVPLPESIPPQDMTEWNASDWFAAADGATASTSDDATRRTSGSASVRFDTDGGFDTYLRYEPMAGTEWDLTAANIFHFDVYAENPSPYGFQVEPIVRFIDLDGDVMEFRYWRNGSPHALWNDARGTWISQEISIKSTDQPATGWRGTTIGTPDWSRMRTVEIHADTWDSRFVLWFDRTGFDMPHYLGDFDQDGDTDGTDFLHWQTSYGQGQSSSADLENWNLHFGTVASKTSIATSASGESEINCSESESEWIQAVDSVFAQTAIRGPAIQDVQVYPSLSLPVRHPLSTMKRLQSDRNVSRDDSDSRIFPLSRSRFASESSPIASAPRHAISPQRSSQFGFSSVAGSQLRSFHWSLLDE